MVNLVHGDLGNFPEKGNNTVHEGTDRSEVVDGNERVHLEISRAQETLNHGETKGLEDNTGDLVQDTDQNEVNLANGSNDDTDNDGGNVEELLEVGLVDAESPAGDEDSDGGGGLEHLDESNREVQVGQVSANQTQTEEQTDGNDSSEIDAAGHLDILAAIKQGGETGHQLGHDSRKKLVVSRQNDGVSCPIVSSMVEGGWVAIARSYYVRNLRVSRSHLLKRITEELQAIQTLETKNSQNRAQR